MQIVKTVSIILVALIHLHILYVEMVLWTTKKGIHTFGLKSKEFAEETKVMAANQGLYNGFLAVGLLWFLTTNNFDGLQFLLICVCIAGLYGAFSTKMVKIFYIQSVPAFVALLLTLLL